MNNAEGKNKKGTMQEVEELENKASSKNKSRKKGKKQGKHMDSKTETKESAKEQEVQADTTLSGEQDEVQANELKLKETEDKLAEMQDKYLRLSAEFDNYRKRTLKEKMELAKTAGEVVLLDILPVMDDFERGLGTVNDATDIEGVKKGMELIHHKLKDFLNRHGIKEIEALHNEFDTDIHEAVTKIEAPEKDLKGKVVDVIQNGYYLNDKVIRFAKVVVGD